MPCGQSTKQPFRLIPFLTMALVMAGVCFRFARFIEPRSFWLDECWVAYDISTRTLGDILLGQNFFSRDFPVLPMGFAFAQKVFVLILGQAEFSYRIFPFICSVLSLVVFARMTKEWFGRHWVALVALALFVSNEQLIHFSAEAKQYSTDVLVCLLILLWAPMILSKLEEKIGTAYAFLILTLSFSYLSIIMWGAVILPALLTHSLKKEGKAVRHLFVFSLCLLGMFALFHGTAIHQMMSNDAISHGALRFFPAQPLLQFNNLSWSFRVFNEMIQNSAGINPSLMGVFLLGVGIVFSCFCQGRKAATTVLPIVMSFVLSLLSIYPFTGRFIIQNTPLVFLLIGEAVFHLSRYPKKRIGQTLAAILSVWLLFNPLNSAIQQMRVKHEIEANRQVIEKLRENMLSGDVVFVSSEGVNPLAYYSSILNPFPPFSRLVVFGENDEYFLKKMLCSGLLGFRRDKNGFLFTYFEGDGIVCHKFQAPPPFLGNRTWLLFSHCEEEFKEAWKRSFCLQGRCTDYFDGPGVSLILNER